MKRILLICALGVATPALAQDDPPLLDNLNPFSERFRSLMEGWADEMMPLMEQLADKMSELNAYEAPEVLPNGDILIRRKPDAPEEPSDVPQANPDGSIDL